VSLGALIRNGMELLWLFSIPYVLFMILHDYDLVWIYFMRCFDEAFVPRLFMIMNLIRCEVLNILMNIL